jgi:phosphatidylserine decarboxylase precursor
MPETFLSSVSHSNFTQNSDLTPLQVSVDGLVSSFVERAVDGYMFLGVLSGTTAGRGFQLGAFRLAQPFANLMPPMASLSRVIPKGIGFFAESAFFEVTPLVARTLSGNTSLSALQFYGETGVARGVVRSGMNLAGFKAAGLMGPYLSPVALNIVQSGAIVATRQASVLLGVDDAFRETLGQQLVDAEAMVLNLNAGLRVFHLLTPTTTQRGQIKDLEIQARSMQMMKLRTTGRSPLQIGPKEALETGSRDFLSSISEKNPFESTSNIRMEAESERGGARDINETRATSSENLPIEAKPSEVTTENPHPFKAKHLIPNGMTLGAAMLAGASMVFSSMGMFKYAAWCLPIAATLDVSDGAVARAIKATHPIGARFDSYADFAAYGMASAFFSWSVLASQGHSTLGLIAAPFIFGGAFLRLGYFDYLDSFPQARWKKDILGNPIVQKRQDFTGMPSTTMGLIIPALYWKLSESPELFFAGAVAGGAAMISPLRYIKFGSLLRNDNDNPWRKQFTLGALGTSLGVAGAVAIAQKDPNVLGWGLLASLGSYLVSPFVEAGARKLNERRNKGNPPSENLTSLSPSSQPSPVEGEGALTSATPGGKGGNDGLYSISPAIFFAPKLALGLGAGWLLSQMKTGPAVASVLGVGALMLGRDYANGASLLEWAGDIGALAVASGYGFYRARSLLKDVEKNPFSTDPDMRIPREGVAPPQAVKSEPVMLDREGTEIKVLDSSIEVDGFPTSFNWSLDPKKGFSWGQKIYYSFMDPVRASVSMGRLSRAPFSRNFIGPFARQNQIPLNRFVAWDGTNNYGNFDNFFTRQLKDLPDFYPGAAPSEGQIVYMGRGSMDQVLNIKGEDISLRDLLGEGVAQAFPNQVGVIVTYLSPKDYHLGHSPVDGTVVSTKSIPGAALTVGPEIWNERKVEGQPGSRYLTFNKRDVVYKHTDQGPLGIVYVAATNVFSTEIHPKVGQRVRAGWQEQTYHFGSTNVYVFDASKFNFPHKMHPGQQLTFGETPFMMPRTGQTSRRDSVPVTPGVVVDNGPFGTFSREVVSGVNVYTPQVASGVATNKGTLLLISGAGGNHTSFAELPSELATEGWKVKLLVYPGYDDVDSPSVLSGGGRKGRKLEKGWHDKMNKVVSDYIRDTDPSHPVYLGGFSMGGSGAVRIYEGLDAAMKKKIQGLILGAPGFHMAALETSNPVRDWAIRRVVLPAGSFLNLSPRKPKKNTSVDPELEKAVHRLATRPWSSEFGAVLFNESARSALLRLQGQSELPRVLLIHGGASDQTVLPKAANLVQGVLKNQVTTVELPHSGHYVFAAPNRRIGFDAVKKFLNPGNK